MKLGEGNWTIKCQTVHAADCAASLLLIITNTSVSFVLFPKKIESSVYFFISTGCFQAMVSAIKIKPFPFVCIATRQLEPHELDNAVSFANPLMTKMWNQEVVGNSSNLWEFLKAEIYFHKVLLKCCCFLFFFGWRSLTQALPCFVVSTGRNLGFWWWLEELAEIAINPLHCFCLKLPFFVECRHNLLTVILLCKYTFQLER